MSNKKVVEKIQKLLAKSRDESCSEAEAEACMERARELMTEHALSEVDVAEKRETAERKNIRPKYFEPWRRSLMHQTAKYYGCWTVEVQDEGDRYMAVMGRPSNILVAESMYDYLEKTTLRLASAHRREVRGARADQLDFERGCGARLAKRLMDLRLAAVSEAGEAEGSGGTSLVLAGELAESRELARAEFPKTTTAGNKIVGRGGGFAAGRAAADGVALGGQIGSAGGRGRLALGK